MPQHLKAALLLALLKSGEVRDALVFTRTKHRADRLAQHLGRARVKVERIHGNRSQAQRTRGARRIQERQVPGAGRHRHRGARHRRHRARPRDQLRRAGAAGRLHPPRRPHRARRVDRVGVHAGVARGRGQLRDIEKAIGKRLPRVTVPDFDYQARPPAKPPRRAAPTAAEPPREDHEDEPVKTFSGRSR